MQWVGPPKIPPIELPPIRHKKAGPPDMGRLDQKGKTKPRASSDDSRSSHSNPLADMNFERPDIPQGSLPDAVRETPDFHPHFC